MTAPRLVHLDMLRGLAALAVVVGHTRGFLYLDYGEIERPTALHMLFYLVTGLGHEAVIAFFALSGYLVGGKALGDILSGRWSWQTYLVARLARLWTVVVPALLLTWAWDQVGAVYSDGRGYAGAYYGPLASGPTPGQPADHSVQALLGNVVFLQTIWVPAYGTNGPLWSLANEFWYYVTAPLLAVGLVSRAPRATRLVSLGLALVLLAVLPRPLVLLGLVWIAGAGAAWLLDARRLHAAFIRPAAVVVLAAALLALIALSKAGRLPVGGLAVDLMLGLFFAALLPGLARMPRPTGVYERVATGLSEISYTLYATHFPLLAMIWFVGLAPAQWPPSPASIAIGIAAVAVAVVYACALWWCFERNTPAVRRAVQARLGLAPARPDAAA